jgi:hypothetical protein
MVSKSKLLYSVLAFQNFFRIAKIWITAQITRDLPNACGPDFSNLRAGTLKNVSFI